MSQLFALVVYALALVIFAEGAAGRYPRVRRWQAIRPRQQTWTLKQTYWPQDFLNWDFFDQSDPTHGMVTYLSKADALAAGLVTATNNTFTLGIDNTTWLGPGQYRDSVRITSPDSFSGGLFIADVQNMPWGCSLWPAYWTVGPNWPNGGEIDIIEGVNDAGTNQMTLHTGPGCSLSPITSAPSPTGSPGNDDCTSSGGNNAGCAYTDYDPQSYGQGFNDNGGGVYAHILGSNGIQIWFFPRGQIPQDITDGTPDPSTWPPAVGSFSADSCDPTHFSNQNIVINISACGDWAGSAYGTQPGSKCTGSCSSAIADPSNIISSSWVFSKIEVYQTY